MELLRQFVDFFLHLDTHLAEIIADYGTWTYAILFLIIFVETGLVIMPLLPGDSLLFAAGTFAALGSLNPLLLIALLVTAAILGDTVNYWIGKRIGARAFSGNIRFLKQSYLERTQQFYERHGGKTIILARFVPIVRTFAPFVAGVGTMTYPKFLAYNVVGAVAWVSGFVTIGYLFGNIPAVKERFSLVILGIIFVSVVPMAIELMRGMRRESGETT
ncbi:MAG TPA: DedA family protein [Gemmatimonadales bacterium]|nr:DedA family protein [Gemmatimonadales bacterium]